MNNVYKRKKKYKDLLLSDLECYCKHMHDCTQCVFRQQNICDRYYPTLIDWIKYLENNGNNTIEFLVDID